MATMEEFNVGCLTCFQPPGLDFLNVQSAENASIDKVLRKHFWFTEADLQLATICQSCWDQIKNFHRFYVSVEELYQSRTTSVIVKSETGILSQCSSSKIDVESNPLEKTVNTTGSAEDDFELIDVDYGSDDSDCVMTVPEEKIEVVDVELHQNLRMVLTDCMQQGSPEHCTKNKDVKIEQQDTEAQAEQVVERIEKRKHFKPTGENKGQSEWSNINLDTDDASGLVSIITKSEPELIESDSLLEPVAESSKNKLDPQLAQKVTVEKCDSGRSDDEQDDCEYVSVKQKSQSRGYIKSTKESLADEDMIRKHVKYICAQCGEDSPTFARFKKHGIQVHGNSAPSVECCGKKYLKRCHLWQHVQVVKNPDKFRCHECKRSFAKKSGYQDHMNVVHATKMFECERCPRTYKKRSRLAMHMEDHTRWDSQLWKCTQCDKLFTDGQSLGAHMLECWSDARKCETCRLVLPSQLALDAHNATEHGLIRKGSTKS